MEQRLVYEQKKVNYLIFISLKKHFSNKEKS